MNKPVDHPFSMRGIFKTLSGKVWVAIVAVQFLMVFAVHDYRDREHHFLTWDAYGYWLYLPGAFIYNDLHDFQFVENQQVAHFISSSPYQIRTLDDGRRVPSYTMGMAVLWLPFFLFAHVFALALDFPADGLTLPYQLGVAAASVFYCAVGFWFLGKMLRRFFTENATGWTLACLFFGSNLFWFFTQNPGLTHGCLFSAFAVLGWLTVRWHEKPTVRLALALAATLAVMWLIRPATGLAVLLPVFYDGLKKSKWQLVFAQKRALLAAFALGLALISPQLLLWKTTSGHWFFNGYAAAGWGFDWLKPAWLDHLFACEKGWLVWSPVFLLALGGFFFLKKWAAGWLPACVVFLLVNSYVVFCYNQWPFDSSFGFRGLVECYPVLALPMAAFFQKMQSKRWLSGFAGLLAVGCIGLNLSQIWQTQNGILRLGPIPKTYYWQVFLKTKRDPRDLRFLDLKERKPFWSNGAIGEFENEIIAGFEFSEKDSLAEAKSGLFAQKTGGKTEFSRAIELVFDEKTAPGLAGKWLTLRGNFFQQPAADEPENCAVVVLEITRPGSPTALKWVGVHLQHCIPAEKWADFEFDATAPTDLRAGDRLRAYLWMPGCGDFVWVEKLAVFCGGANQ